jgi:succinoglycan biosynthesis protein ExoV
MLYYFRNGNFGDELNPWLWKQLCPEVTEQRKDRLFLGIGTILSRSVPAEPIKVVFGSGASGVGQPSVVDGRWRVFCVRGPLTARKLNLDAKLALTDGAILVRRVRPPDQKKKYPVSIMLHHQSMDEADWKELASRVGIHCIDPCGKVEQVLAEMMQTELLLTEAMHGAIVADALRVPWIPVRLYPRFNEFKWQDWSQSVQLPLDVPAVPPVYQRSFFSQRGLRDSGKRLLATAGVGKAKWRHLSLRPSYEREIKSTLNQLKQLARQKQPCLSDDGLLRSLEERAFEKLNAIREAWRGAEFA